MRKSYLKFVSSLLIIMISVSFLSAQTFAAYPGRSTAVDYSSWTRTAPAAVPTPEPPYEGPWEDVKIGEATTYFEMYGTQANRASNIRLASKSIDEYTVQIGEVFSFNKTVGPRTYARGYLDATIFVGDERMPGVGGGICQVSSTLYMACKKAGVQIVERYKHSIPVTYCSREDEATVSWGVLDYKFKNNTSYQLKISAKVTGNRLTVTIYKRIPIQ